MYIYMFFRLLKYMHCLLKLSNPLYSLYSFCFCLPTNCQTFYKTDTSRTLFSGTNGFHFIGIPMKKVFSSIFQQH